MKQYCCHAAKGGNSCNENCVLRQQSRGSQLSLSDRRTVLTIVFFSDDLFRVDVAFFHLFSERLFVLAIAFLAIALSFSDLPLF